MQDPRAGLGEELRRARVARGLSLAQAERLTKIRAVHLAALEEERFADLPPRPYAKGFVRAYALALGLDPAGLLTSFDAHLPPVAPPPLSEAVEIPLEAPAPPSRLRRAVTLALWILIPAAVLGAIGLYVNLRTFVQSGPGSAPSPAAVSPAPAPSPPGAVAPPPTAPSPAAVAPSPGVPEPRAITIVLTVSEESWLRVIVDGKRIFQGHMYPGDTGSWTAERELEIKIGNAGGVQLTVNGRDLGVPGRPREVVTLRFPESPEEP